MDIASYLSQQDHTQSLITDTVAWCESPGQVGIADAQTVDAIGQRLNSSEVYVALLGRQGVGKSSLGNALLGGRRIFPMDVDETTNVLTMVAGLPVTEAEYGEIIFHDGRTSRIDVSDSALRPFIDEQQNPDNEKGVREVRCHLHVEWLEKCGVWLVDTPGINSLTKRNHELTYDFLPKVSIGIFLCSVNPPIMADEKDFLRAIWRQRPLMFFVQNRWNENLEQVRESEQYSLAALQDVAEAGAAEESFYTINTNAGLSAFELQAEERDDELDYSGLAVLQHDIATELSEKLRAARLRLSLGALEVQITTPMTALRTLSEALAQEITLSTAQLGEDKAKKQEAASHTTKRLRDLHKEVNAEIAQAHENGKSEVSERVELVRNEMFAEIELGGVSPDYFEEQFRRAAARHLDPPIDADHLANVVEKYMRCSADEFLSFQQRLGAITEESLQQTCSFSHQHSPDLTTEQAVDGETFLKIVSYGMSATGLFRTGAIVWAVGSAAWAGIAGTTGVVAAISGGASAAGVAFAAVPVIGWVIAGALVVSGFLFKKWAKRREQEALREATNKALQIIQVRVLETIVESSVKVPAALAESQRTFEDQVDRMLADSIAETEALAAPLEGRKAQIGRVAEVMEEGRLLIERCSSLGESVASR